jgi:ADP-dependent phosphofructokinase/glucokinase
MFFETVLGPISEVAIFTDGLQHLALTYKDKTVYKKFFKPMFNSMHNLSEFQKERVNASLCSFLDSQSVNSRTDDDKTLVLAVRQGGSHVRSDE